MASRIYTYLLSYYLDVISSIVINEIRMFKVIKNSVHKMWPKSSLCSKVHFTWFLRAFCVVCVVRSGFASNTFSNSIVGSHQGLYKQPFTWCYRTYTQFILATTRCWNLCWLLRDHVRITWKSKWQCRLYQYQIS